jgi:DNA polymerase I-like protein with 3'-5' exonuclease and polymerase domains
MKTELVVGDFETYWSDTHSLSKMSALEYVMSPKTELISLALKKEGKSVCVFGEKNIRELVSRIDWSNKLLVAHNNSEFDAMIFAFRLGVKPKMWGCTLAMARPIHAKDAGGSLSALVEHYGLGKKDSSALIATKGKHLKDFTPEEIAAMRTYNMMDAEQCYNLFYKLLPQTPKSEMKVIDATIRMLVEPQFVLDEPLLTKTLALEQEHKRDMLVALAVKTGAGSAEEIRKVLASAPKFAAFLTDNGVPVPMKLNPKGKSIPALAKTDEGFIALTEHEDELIAAAANTRLGVKSTQLETRIVKFLDAAHHCNGRVPVPIKYYGADTTGRWSGFWYNLQNLPRILRSAPKLSDALRYSLMAPPGYKVVVADLSGIELRVNMTLWRVPYAMELLAADPEADLYKPLASEVLGVPIDGMPKMVRQAGKAMHLGGGFGLRSPEKYVAVAKQMAQITVSLEDADKHILGYRAKHPEIVQGWKTCHRALDYVYSGDKAQIDPWGLCHTSKEGIVTPKGVIRYPDLRKEMNEDSGKTEWVYGTGRKKARIYAGKVDENIVQHLARHVLSDNMLEARQQTGYWPVHTVHDELIYIVPEDQAQAQLDTVQAVMRTPPVWWPELVVYSEGSIGDNYGEAK